MPDGSMFVFGGFMSSSARLNDCWRFNPDKNEWSAGVEAHPAPLAEGEDFSSARAKMAAARSANVVPKPKMGNVLKSEGGEEEKKGGEKKEKESSVTNVGTITPGSGSNFLESFGVALMDPEIADYNPLAPSPRGAHSATLIDGKLWVFGGYGGTGYARRDFNDLHALDAATSAWVPVESEEAPITGTPPQPRSGHVGVPIKQTLLIVGGWSGLDTYADAFLFDTETRAWSAVESGKLWLPRWNSAAVSVPAVPFWQVFGFGGSGPREEQGADKAGEGSYLADTLHMDTGKMRWRDLGAAVAGVQVEPGAPPPAAPLPGDGPSGRCDHSVVYDSGSKRLVVFGGWANRWHGDAVALSVSQVVGPPYAILGVSPPLGPITGAQKIKITGLGFEPGRPLIARFIMGRKFIDSEGAALSATEAEVSTPNFEALGPGTVEVRICLRGGLLSITDQPYSFFLVTAAPNCYAWGPGVLKSGVPAGAAVPIVIQSRDTSNADRKTGGDVYSVKVFRMPPGQGEHAKAAVLPKGCEPEELPEGTVAIKDEDNGRHIATWTPDAPGVYRVTIDFTGTYSGPAGPVRGSPFSVTVIDPSAEGATPVKDAGKLNGPLMWDFINSQVLDKYGKMLKTMHEGMVKETNPDSPLELVLGIKNTLTAVVNQETELRLMMDVCGGALAVMKKEAGKEAKLLKENSASSATLDKVLAQFEEVRREVPKCRNTIAPLVKKFSADTKKDIEGFEKETTDFMQELDTAPSYWKFDSGPTEAGRALTIRAGDLRDWLKKVDKMQQMANTFEYPQMLAECHKMCKTAAEDIEEMKRLWGLAGEFDTFSKGSREILWSELSPDALEESAKAIQKKVKTGGNRKTRGCPMFKGIDKTIRDFLATMPLVGSLRHKSMRPRHWDLLGKATKKEFTPPHLDPNLKLQGLLNLQLHEFGADVEEITDQAIKEEKMEDTLAKLKETWAAVVFLSDPYKPGSDVMLLKLGEEDFESLEADQLAVQGMMASRYLATFETEITAWQKELSTVAEVFLALNDIQRKWSYLEPLFVGSEEVKRELPEDAQRFVGLNATVITMLKEMLATGNVKAACNKPGLVKLMEDTTTGLDRCEKSLADFLAGKQRQFPRFYFVSKSDLLDILSNGSQPYKIQEHITKVFLQTDKLFLKGGEDGLSRPTALGWKSGVGVEDGYFSPPFTLEGKVEIYLQTVKDAQEAALKGRLESSLARRPTQKRVDWLINREPDGKPSDPAQLSLLVSGMEYVNNVERSFEGIAAGDPDALIKCEKLASDELSELVRLTQTNLSKADRTRVMCMITLDAHGRDIITKMILEKVVAKTEFQWQSQLKARMLDGHATICVADAKFRYSYEYLGNGPRLVITPLTDRIYVTATQALNLKMGCAPAGPAGTGKTESTKDLANALAITCYVFNCSPEMDYQSLGNIFKGLSASGTWGCFDEFNRLVPEVLSVCSVQFKAVCDGIKAQNNTVTIEGVEVSLKWTAGAFITMNPGYLGRSELPEGLKALFRPITVMVPDLILICENMLMAEGFVEAKVLASKFFSLYYLLAQLLSKQSHYDWGLRAIKSVLVVAGGFKRAEPDLPEQALLMRALRDFNTPKIVKQDEVIFFGLLGDLFPGIDPPRKLDPSLETAVVNACIKKGIDPEPAFCLKAVQLEELLAIRHCIFVMGPAAAGKSSCWQALQLARVELKRKTKAVDLDPKAVSPEELYGYVHPATREWKDGLLSKIMRDLGREEGTDDKWILLDGDLDANWIESMNSVMDDNKMLTLASNERIPLKGHMRMIFEIRDLNHATPATVSRAGIIYISTNTGSQWRSLIKSWLLKLEVPENLREALRKMFDTYCAPSLLFLKKECKPMVPCEDTTLITNLLRLLKTQMTPAFMKKLLDPAQTPPAEMDKVMETYFVFCAIWALGSALSKRDGEDYRLRFSEYWRSNFKAVKINVRGGETVFDYFLEPASLAFEPWNKSPHFSTVAYDSRKTPMGQVTVPTAETCSIQHWMELLLAQRDPIMLVGYAGCGKTQLVNGLLSKQNPEERLSHTVNFNYYTDAKALQSIMEQPLEKKTGTNYGPPGKAYLIYYLDDLNLPEVDRYDTQSAIALVREHFDYGHWYDRTKLQLKNIGNCQYIASLNPTAGSFVINQRLQRWFFTLAVGFPGVPSLFTIYETFLGGHLTPFAEDVQAAVKNILICAIDLHQEVASNFRKSAQNFHYEFNVRHLSNVFQGILQSNPNEFKTLEKFVQLWLHESERVYGDRLVSLEDLDKYRGLAATSAKKKFSAAMFSQFFGDKAESLVFFHFAETVAEKCYDKVNSMDKLRGILDESLREYNENFAAMDLVLFEDAMKHVCRISRIILNPSGHALLVGVGGSGKQSLTRLASYICSYRVYQITISGSYGINDLKEDLKAMYNISGVKEEGVTFLFTDSQITNERFLVFMNDLLASGNIPDLFTPEEFDTIINTMTPRVKAAGGTPDRGNCWDLFLTTVKKNLHVVMCFSPVGEDMKIRAKRFPALVNCTVIHWFQPWPRDALFSVGSKFLKEVEGISSDATRMGIERFMPYSFESVNKAAVKYMASDRRYVYTTPKSYLELLKLYKNLLKKKRAESEAAITRLSNGLNKLRDTAEVVAKIEEQLKVMLADAEEAKAKATAIASDVAANAAIVAEETEKANAIAAEAAVIADSANTIRMDAEADLAKAIPAVEAAMAALNTLDKKALGECSKMQTPPAGVDDIFSACVVLLAGIHKGVKCAKNGKVADADRSWGAAKKQILTDVQGFLNELLNYKAAVDAGTVPAMNFNDVRPYLALPHFNAEAMKTKNSAAVGLTNWVVNIVGYRDIVVTVEPKKAKAAAAAKEAEEAEAKKSAAETLVAELTLKLNELKAKLAAAEADKAAAEEVVRKGKEKADLANRLTNALADENVRWAASIERLNAEQEMLVGDTLLSASFISYIGAFTKRYRDSLLTEWATFLETAANGGRIPMALKPNPLEVLTTDAQVAGWNSEGLPNDKVSVENGCIVTNTARWPLLIDPQLQGITWIRQREAANGMIVVRMEQKDMLRKMEGAIEKGCPVLVENMGERIDAVLSPIIARQLIKKGSRQYVKVGEKELEFNPKFKLYLHTKLSNPHYPPEVQAEACLVNFTVTELGLEDQMLNVTVGQERPDLATLKSDIIKQQNAFKIQMKELEDGILKRLADAEGDITDDRELIESLENSKRVATVVAEKQAAGLETEKQINVTSEKYRPVAHRASLLFFLLNDLFKCHTYYIYSLSAFVTIFLRSIEVVSGANDPMFPEEAGEDSAEAPAAAAAEEAAAAAPLEGGGGAGEASAAEGAEGAAAAAEGGGAAAAEAEGAPAEAAPAEAAPAEGAAAVPAGKKRAVRVLTDDELVKRCVILKDSATLTTFNYINRGMFERDKLTVATQLCLKIMVDNGELTGQQVSALVIGLNPPADCGTSGALSEWLPDNLWPRVKSLESLKPGPFEKLGEDMTNDSGRWRDWFDGEKPESMALPGEYKTAVKPFNLLLLLRAMRPDRLVTALSAFVGNYLGRDYIVAKPFDMALTYKESSRNTPTFFVLFPGVDPTVWVEALGNKLGFTSENGRFLNISMGQGQELPAEKALNNYAQHGGWLMLQNVHLMSSWVPKLERQLEQVADTAHADFRCFISAEPPGLSYMKNMPESLMQTCIKVANEAPADLLSNLTRSWVNFSQERIEQCNKAPEFKACLFTLVWYHSVICGRRRFGQQGWSRKYSFNVGDLTVCANVLMDYINNNPKVPWDDLRYIFGEIMYGGHITDAWDRRTNNTYLSVFLKPEIMSGYELGQGFPVPDPVASSFSSIMDYFNTSLPKESPVMFGLHPNAEIGYLTAYQDDIFKTILSLGGGSAGGGGGGGGGGGLRSLLTDLKSRLPENFQMIDIEARAEPLYSGASAPYVIVAVQECERMNVLLNEMRRSLVELEKGLNGELNMSEAMEDLSSALSIFQVPGRNPFHKTSWEKYAWPSKKGLNSWFLDLLRRVDQLNKWSSTLETPLSIWLPGIFNPMAVLTAIMQVTARSTGLPLDKMAVDTHVTTFLSPAEATTYPENGMYCHGLYMEGARWAIGEEAGDPVVVGTTSTAGFIIDSKLKQLLPPMPLICEWFFFSPSLPSAFFFLSHRTHTTLFFSPCRSPRRARAAPVDSILCWLPARAP